MRIILKRNHNIFPYQQVFGSTTDFSATLLVDAGFLDTQAVGAVDCTAFTADKVKSGETGKRYDHNYLWGQMIALGKSSQFGASPQDAFSTAVKGQRTVDGVIETSNSYYQTDVGQFDFFTNVKSAIQMEFNKGRKRPVGVGTFWYAEWNGLDPNSTMPEGRTHISDHEWLVCGWDKEHPNCFKIDSHQGYYMYMPKDVFNKAMDATYGSVALTLAETDAERIDFLKEINYSYIQAIIDYIYNALKVIQAKINTLPKPPVPSVPVPDHPLPPGPTKPISRIKELAKSMEVFEGYFAPGEDPRFPSGSPAWRNKNPGNCKAKDGKFLVFKTKEEGFNYLCDYLTRACTGKHDAYKPEMTLNQFTHIYTSDKEPAPTNYAKHIANDLMVSTTTKLKELV